jgi:hypothetical protein
MSFTKAGSTIDNVTEILKIFVKKSDRKLFLSKNVLKENI